MLDGNMHVSSVCDSTPACLVSTSNTYYNSSTTDWGCPPLENRLGEMYNQESNFWANGDQMDPIWNSQDATLAEHGLGFDPGGMEGQSYYRFNDTNPSDHNYRLATGHEPGANEHFTGLDNNGNIDPSVYNGKTSGYVDEAVSDKVPMSDINVEGPREFTSPAKDAAVLNNAAEEIGEMPPGPARDAMLSDYNNRVDALSNKIDGEKDYLNNRANGIQADIDAGKYSGNDLEQARAQAEADWCKNYSDQLQNTQNEAEATRNDLNSSLGNNEDKEKSQVEKDEGTDGQENIRESSDGQENIGEGTDGQENAGEGADDQENTGEGEGTDGQENAEEGKETESQENGGPEAGASEGMPNDAGGQENSGPEAGASEGMPNDAGGQENGGPEAGASEGMPNDAGGQENGGPEAGASEGMPNDAGGQENGGPEAGASEGMPKDAGGQENGGPEAGASEGMPNDSGSQAPSEPQEAPAPAQTDGMGM